MHTTSYPLLCAFSPQFWHQWLKILKEAQLDTHIEATTWTDGANIDKKFKVDTALDWLWLNIWHKYIKIKMFTLIPIMGNCHFYE